MSSSISPASTVSSSVDGGDDCREAGLLLGDLAVGCCERPCCGCWISAVACSVLVPSCPRHACPESRKTTATSDSKADLRMTLIVHAGSIGHEQSLDVRWRTLLQQCQRQKNARLLRIELIGCDEPELVVVQLNIASNQTRGYAAAANHNYSLFHCPRGRIHCRLVHVPVANASDDDALRSILHAVINEI